MEIALVILSVVLNAMLDLSTQGKFTNKKLNMKDTWKNKWKNGDPKQGERFPLSSTAFVWLTDFFHFIKAVNMVVVSILLAQFLNVGFLGFLLIIFLWGLLFELVYRNVDKFIN